MTTLPVSNISDILKMLIAQSGLREAELARRMEIPVATLNKIKKGRINDPRGSTLLQLADYFGLTVDQLLGNTPIEKGLKASICHVPILDEDKILSTNLQMLNYKNHDKWLSCNFSHSIVRHKTLAMQVNGDAMYPLFDRSTVIVIDADATPKSHQYVLAFIKSRGELVLRELLIDGGLKILKALDKNFASIEMCDGDYIVGTVIHSVRKY